MYEKSGRGEKNKERMVLDYYWTILALLPELGRKGGVEERKVEKKRGRRRKFIPFEKERKGCTKISEVKKLKWWSE